MNANQLKLIIENKLKLETISFVSSTDDVHFNATIISDAFEGIASKLKQQKIVYGIIQEYITSGEIHAITMKTYNFQQWKKG